ncbi:hypothetical protein [Streptomyces rubiginosohelvolus]|uniref:hypothetical protein n=1 Tax=Streptomyces rubiginosohelvolus TaxID=67362 RepID=UPI0036ACDA28
MDDLTAGPDARLAFSYRAKNANLVLAGTGKVTVIVDGRTTKTIDVSGSPTTRTRAPPASNCAWTRGWRRMPSPSDEPTPRSLTGPTGHAQTNPYARWLRIDSISDRTSFRLPPGLPEGDVSS